MQVLLTSSPSVSHFFPMVPLAWAVRAAGHGLDVVTLPHLARQVAATGLPARPMGPEVDFTHLTGEGQDQWSASTNWYLSVAELLLRELDDAVADLRPDLVIHDPVDLAGPLIAQSLGIPSVMHNWGIPVAGEQPGPLRSAAVELRARRGLPEEVPPPSLALDVCPPSYQENSDLPHPKYRPPPHRRWMRYVPYNGSAPAPGWTRRKTGAIRVCVTAGHSAPVFTEFNLAARTVEALSGVVDEIVVLCRGEDADAFAEAPGNVRVAPLVPLNMVVPTCDLVVHHGGAGVCLTSMVHGVPQLLVPVVADQIYNAVRVPQVGLGRSIITESGAELREAVPAAAVREHALSVLADDACRAAAEEIAREMADQPSPAAVVELLEAMVP